ncbi:MAG: DUF2797 domain-containing protein [Parahaliea sp.]
MAQQIAAGLLRKMQVEPGPPVQYKMLLDEHQELLNPLLGQTLQLDYLGVIHCIACQRKIGKSFNQGYCYPCFKRLAQCDSCIVSPQKCHYQAGTCREPEWGQTHCMIDHIVYLANTSGLKVGITRHSQLPTRWIDQGASQAQPVFRVGSRYLSGLVEVLFKEHVADRTNWQTMLKGPGDVFDLEEERQRLMVLCSEGIDVLQQEYGGQLISTIEAATTTVIDYPVLAYPLKVKAFNLDKTPSLSGTLMGIKGQYLIFDTGVINLRKYGGYKVALSQI